MAIGANACHGFLADVAALGETDCLLRPRHLLGQVRIVDVSSIKGRARLNPKGIVRLESGGACSCRQQRRPHRGGTVALAKKIVSEQAERLVAANLAISAGDRQSRVPELDKLRYALSACALQSLSRSWTGHVHHRDVVRPIRQFDLLGNEIAVEMPENLFGHTRPRVQEEHVMGLRIKRVINDDKGDNLRLAGGQERLAACPGRQILDFVRTQIMQKRRSIGSAGLYLAMVADIEQGRVLAGTVVLGDGVAIVARH